MNAKEVRTNISPSQDDRVKVRVYGGPELSRAGKRQGRPGLKSKAQGARGGSRDAREQDVRARLDGRRDTRVGGHGAVVVPGDSGRRRSGDLAGGSSERGLGGRGCSCLDPYISP